MVSSWSDTPVTIPTHETSWESKDHIVIHHVGGQMAANILPIFPLVLGHHTRYLWSWVNVILESWLFALSSPFPLPLVLNQGKISASLWNVITPLSKLGKWCTSNLDVCQTFQFLEQNCGKEITNCEHLSPQGNHEQRSIELNGRFYLHFQHCNVYQSQLFETIYCSLQHLGRLNFLQIRKKAMEEMHWKSDYKWCLICETSLKFQKIRRNHVLKWRSHSTCSYEGRERTA